MEYVDGIPLDEYCNQRRLSVNERLALFRTVCAAVHGYYQGIDSTGAPFQGDIVFTGPSGRKYLGLRTLAGQTIYFTGEKD